MFFFCSNSEDLLIQLQHITTRYLEILYLLGTLGWSRGLVIYVAEPITAE